MPYFRSNRVAPRALRLAAIFRFTNSGPLGFIDDKNQVVAVLDWQDVLEMATKPHEEKASA
jgi:hypothetical protein